MGSLDYSDSGSVPIYSFYMVFLELSGSIFATWNSVVKIGQMVRYLVFGLPSCRMNRLLICLLHWSQFETYFNPCKWRSGSLSHFWEFGQDTYRNLDISMTQSVPQAVLILVQELFCFVEILVIKKTPSLTIWNMRMVICSLLLTTVDVTFIVVWVAG